MKKLSSVFLVLFLATGSFAADVPPESVWRQGLKTLVGKTFGFNHVSSPGGLWQSVYDATTGQRILRKQTALDDVLPTVKKQIQSAEIKIESLESGKIELADRTPSPGQRGQPPYSNVMLFYRETGVGKLSFKNLPGVGLEGDRESYQGRASFTLSHASSTDPSDYGLLKQRINIETSWGVAALISMYAQLSAASIDDQGNEGEFSVLENLRLLRGGQEMIAWVEYEHEETAPEGKKLRYTYQGSLNLVAQ